MSVTPREIGTLIVVILRANHLPNKRHIGKQDPYCALTLNGEKRRTKAIKKGGQHPEWDEEIRFSIFEDVDDLLARTAKGDGTPPPPPPKDDNRVRKIKGGKTMKLACYADDPREPDFIGDCDVNLTEVLTKGETDDWFTLMNKDKFAGKVYLELTFWSNEPAPEKKSKPKVPKNNKQYAGPGSFTPAGDAPPGSSRIPHSRQPSDVLPSSMRSSSSAANLYVAPYERNQTPQIDNLSQEFSEFGVSSQPRRRESFPPVPGAYSHISHYGGGHSTLTTYPSHGYDQSTASGYAYDRPLTPNGQSSIYFPQSGASALHYPSYQQAGYETTSPTTYQPPARGPRHSIATSSGFMPLPQPSGFMPLASHTSEPSGFAPPVSHTPAPLGFNSQFQSQPQNIYPPPVSHTPAPLVNASYLPQSSSLSFHPQQSLPASHSYDYSTFGISSSASAPPHQFMSTPSPQSTFTPHANSAPPQMYPTSPHEIAASPTQMSSYPNGHASRPLPQQPQVMYSQPPGQSQTSIPSHSLPEPPPPPPINSFEVSQANNNYPANNTYSSIPPPPPPPPLQYNSSAPAIPSTGSLSQLAVPPPPPPPPLAGGNSPSRVRRTSLPVPPVAYQQSNYQQQQLPPPPPPPLEFFNQAPPPPPPPLLDTNTGTYNKGLPKPPVPVNEHGQWTQPTNGYTTNGY